MICQFQTEEAQIKITEVSGERVDNKARLESIRQEEAVLKKELEEEKKEEEIAKAKREAQAKEAEAKAAAAEAATTAAATVSIVENILRKTSYILIR